MRNQNHFLRFLNVGALAIGIVASVFTIESHVRAGFDVQGITWYSLFVFFLFILYLVSYRVKQDTRRKAVLFLVAAGFGCVIYFIGRADIRAVQVLYDSIDQASPRMAFTLNHELSSKFSLNKKQLGDLANLLRQSGMKAAEGSYVLFKLVDKKGQFLGHLQLYVMRRQMGYLSDGTPYGTCVDISFLAQTAMELRELYEGEYGGPGSEIDTLLEGLKTAPVIVTQKVVAERLSSISSNGFYIDWDSGKKKDATSTLLKNLESYDVGNKILIDMRQLYFLPLRLDLSILKNEKRKGDNLFSEYIFTKPLVYKLKVTFNE